MRVALVTGIYPPDIGGPATHSVDLRTELLRRGHQVTVVTLHDGQSRLAGSDLIRFPRRWPWPVRLAAVAGWLATNRRRLDVVYATGLHPAAVVGARLAGKPLVLKIVGDPVWERGRRIGATGLAFVPFQDATGRSFRVLAMRMVRDWSLRQASALTTPSRFLARTVEGWLKGPADVRFVPNGVRQPQIPLEETASGPLRLIYVGRLIADKRIDAIIRAVGKVEGAELDIVGNGPERDRLARAANELGLAGRVHFLGELPNEAAIRRIAAADALVLASDIEGFPHVALEALTCGTPVISVAVGGVEEIVRNRASGLIVQSVTDIATALDELRTSPSLRKSLSEGARSDGRRWGIEATADGIEGLLREAIRGKPHVVYFGRTRLPQHLTPELLRKLEVLQRHTRPVLLTTGQGLPRFVGCILAIPLPDNPVVGAGIHYAAGAILATLLATGSRRGAVLCQSPYEGCGVVALSRAVPRRLRPSVIVEVHGDWRTASRLYGSGARKALGPIADRVAEWTLRRADRVRVVSAWLEELVRASGVTAQIDRFPAFMDLETFDTPSPIDPPAVPAASYVGALERVKGVDVLIEAWPKVIERIPEARLWIAGEGQLRSVIEARAAELGLGESVTFLGVLSRADVRAAIDATSCLVVPSRSEGLGRVIVEAMLRGRAVVASSVGGIPEWVVDGLTGRLVPPDDHDALADAVSEILGDSVRTRSMGSFARLRAETACRDDRFSAGIERMADWVRAR